MPDLKLDCALLLCYGTPASLGVMGGSRPVLKIQGMIFEEIISAEFLVSLRTSIHFPSFAFTERALYGCGNLDRM